ncbi:MAG: ATP-binding cassette domain-containing protein, partial [Bacillota bacterium]|nr:ATP-binding cassette domain-containing protein [Bacillota bacterium]
MTDHLMQPTSPLSRPTGLPHGEHGAAPSVRVHEVSFTSTDDHHILDSIAFQIERGECVLICGRSGSGKTTITKLINALIPHYMEGNLQGTVEVCGVPTIGREIFEVSRFVSSVFQNPKSQFFNITTTAEIVFYMENRG